MAIKVKIDGKRDNDATVKWDGGTHYIVTDGDGKECRVKDLKFKGGKLIKVTATRRVGNRARDRRIIDD